jgi:HK97 family phage major capsid protein
MPYNSIISRANAASLVPTVVANEILEHLPQMNPIMQLARRLPNMSTNQTRLPVVSALATAYFVSGDTGLKQTSQMTWANTFVDAEELAVIVPIPQSVLDDASYDIWANVKPEVERAFSVAISQAVLYGTNIPASWTTDLGAAGIQALCASSAAHQISRAAFADDYEAILGISAGGTLGMWAAIEADGYMPTGFISHVAGKAQLRNTRATGGELIFKSSVQDPSRWEIDGVPVYFPTDGSMSATGAATAGAFVGQWDQLVYSMRQDITYKILTEAVIQDGTGAIVYNLAQQDMVALRAVMRLGFAVPNPINRMNGTAATRIPFSMLVS